MPSWSALRRMNTIRALSTVLAIGILGGCATTSPNYNNQKAFRDPESAVRALESAVKAGDRNELEAIFGAGSAEVLSSGDPVADAHNREVFTVAMGHGWKLERTGSRARELVVGHDEWPFPIPLVSDKNGWWFDTEAGEREVLARRIGRNELAAIGALRTYVIAQREYAAVGRDGRQLGIYAQKLRSDPGRNNGLYWDSTDSSAPPSPLGAFAAAAAAEGYGANPTEGAAPYRGYFYRILTSQGPGAPGGERNYVVNGEMTGGFGLIAYPAEYGNSGIMTFMVGPDGVIYERDLGEETGATAAGIGVYDPTPSWSPVQD